MRIVGVAGLTTEQLRTELRRGARFVVYEFCVSLLFITVRQSSDVYFIRAGQTRFRRGLGFTSLSLLTGWWAIPFGPILTIVTVVRNLAGGTDVTRKIVE